MTRIHQGLRLNDQDWARFAWFSATLWIQIGNPDFAAIRHPSQFRFAQTQHSRACFRAELCARLDDLLGTSTCFSLSIHTLQSAPNVFRPRDAQQLRAFVAGSQEIGRQLQ